MGIGGSMGAWRRATPSSARHRLGRTNDMPAAGLSRLERQTRMAAPVAADDKLPGPYRSQGVARRRAGPLPTASSNSAPGGPLLRRFLDRAVPAGFGVTPRRAPMVRQSGAFRDQCPIRVSSLGRDTSLPAPCKRATPASARDHFSLGLHRGI